MKNPKIDSTILARLLLLQSSLQAAPNTIRLGEQVCYILQEIPGIQSTALYINEEIIAHTPPKTDSFEEWPPSYEQMYKLNATNTVIESSNLHLLSIRTNKTVFGYFLIALSDHKPFSTYLPYIENTINLVALMLENWKQAKELQKERDFLNAVLDNIEDGIVACNEKGILTLFNRATREIHGIPEKPIPAEEWAEHYDLYLADGITRMHREDIPLYRAFQGENVKNMELVISPKHDKARTLRATGQPLIDHDNNILGAVVSMHDITLRKHAEEALRKAHDDLENKVIERTLELRQSNEQLAEEMAERKNIEIQLRQAHKMEAIGTLAGGIAHDFNNILAAILGYADMAKDDLPYYSPVKYQIEQVIKAGNRAKDLVKQILHFSRNKAEERVPVQIHLIANEALKLLRATIPTTIEIIQNIDPTCGNILAEPTQIHQVLLNICTNAAQAMDAEGGTLTVSLGGCKLTENTSLDSTKSKEYIRLSVKDTGPGIDDDLHDRIFDPYFTTKEVGKGSGMGLAVVAGIVRSHGGIIQVGSKPGEGSEFKVLFPRLEEKTQQDSEFSSPPPTGNERILIVDDDESMTDMTKLRVERLGYQVTATTSSKEALETFRSQPDSFDLVITDQTMPELTGEKLAKELLRLRHDIPIIICTGYSSNLDAEKANFVGISAFIMKPVDKSELARTIRNVLEKRTS